MDGEIWNQESCKTRTRWTETKTIVYFWSICYLNEKNIRYMFNIEQRNPHPLRMKSLMSSMYHNLSRAQEYTWTTQQFYTKIMLKYTDWHEGIAYHLRGKPLYSNHMVSTPGGSELLKKGFIFVPKRGR